MNLFQINEKLNDLLEVIQFNGGEVTPLEDTMLEKLQLDFAHKIEAIVNIIAHENARVKACENEIKRLGELADKAERKVEWLKNYLTLILKPGTNWDGGTFKIGWRKSTRCEPLVDTHLMHQEFIRIIPEKREIDKEKLKLALKQDDPVAKEFGKLIEVQNIQIK